MKKKYYLAYGSNMNLPQMEVRCEDAEYLGVVTLEAHDLVFVGPEGQAVATVRENPERSVPCVLWKISPKDEASLDRYEGFPRLYRKEQFTVKYKNRKTEAFAYVMNDDQPLGAPNPFYYKTIMDGYSQSDLSLKPLYIAMIESMGDGDMKRQIIEMFGNSLDEKGSEENGKDT